MAKRKHLKSGEGRWQPCLGFIMAALGAGVVFPSQAVQIETGNPDLRVTWDTTIKYSNAFRVKSRSEHLVSNPAQDDGDRNFSRGLVSNRFDVLSEMDVVYKNVGLRISGAAWYDDVYRRSNDNDSPGTSQGGSAYNHFADGTRRLHGKQVELLDAFVFGHGDLGGGVKGSFRLGRHALLWGESLFFGNNGIAAGQAPIDVVKALSVPNTQFKELIRPVNQISGQLQLTPDLSVGAYYQFEWEKTRLPGAGSYFSGADLLDAGGYALQMMPPIPGLFPNGVSALRKDDMKARNSGQGGVQIRYRLPESGYDFGLYAIRYHDKTPQSYTSGLQFPFGPNGGVALPSHYQLIYPEAIKAYGFSVSTSVGNANVAAEVSTRRNAPLVSDPVEIGFDQSADNNGNARYAVGNTLHAQVSMLYSLEPNFIARESSLIGEIAWNRVLSCTRNCEHTVGHGSNGPVDRPNGWLGKNTTRDAWGLRMVYTPTYRQVLPGLDISVPIGISYFPQGRSGAVAAFGPHKGGDISIGVNGVYLDKWRFGLNYTHFYGSEDIALNADNVYTYRQNLRDRNFISFTASTSF